jgi:hypothetical protein
MIGIINRIIEVHIIKNTRLINHLIILLFLIIGCTVKGRHIIIDFQSLMNSITNTFNFEQGKKSILVPRSSLFELSLDEEYEDLKDIIDSEPSAEQSSSSSNCSQ